MNPSEWSALLLLAAATSFTPGPNTTLSTALAANGGLRHAMPFVLSVPVGWALLLVGCAAGVGTLVVALPWLRGLVVLSGVSYLVWLAFKLGRSARLAGLQPDAVKVSFLHGVGLQFVNIKAWMLALSIVAGWIAGQPDAWLRVGMVLPVMVCFALASNLAYALVGSSLRHWLSGPWALGQPTYRRLAGFNRGMAVALVATAVWMLWSHSAH